MEQTNKTPCADYCMDDATIRCNASHNGCDKWYCSNCFNWEVMLCVNCNVEREKQELFETHEEIKQNL